MKKKVNVFGKSIPVLAIFVLGIALVSAALVPYLSNAITGNVVVDSPMAMSTAQGDYDGSHVTLDFANTHGGETFSYKVYSKNQGSIDVDTYPITTIISANGWTGDEFTSVNFENEAGDKYYNGPILDNLYVVKDDGTLSSFTTGDWETSGVANLKELKLFFDNNGDGVAQKYTHIPGESWNEITMTTALTIAPDTYSVKLCHIDNLVTGSCA